MNKFRIYALLSAGMLTLSCAVGCGDKTQVSSVNENKYASVIEDYADDPEIGKEQIDVTFNEQASHNDTDFQLHRVIDSGRVLDGKKYIYLDVTIKNNSDTEYSVNALNNFYLILNDGYEVMADIRADLYAKQHINGYEQLLKIGAGEEFKGYVGFCVDEAVEEFTMCFFATGLSNDKSSVIKCVVKPEDIIPAPDGFIK